MSIAEKLTTIAENQQKVYDAGYTDGSNSAQPTELPSYFKIPDWNELGEKEVVLDVPSKTNFKRYMYRTSINTTVEHLTLNGSQNGTITSMEECFSGVSSSIDKTLKRLTLNCNLSNCTNFTSMCVNTQVLEVIDGTPIDFSSATSTNQIFGYGCFALKEFRVKPLSIKKSLDIQQLGSISNDTIQSIVDGLADLKGQTKQTIAFGFGNTPNVTEAQKATITSKNWNATYMYDD